MRTSETKNDKFARLSESRLSRAKNELRLISQLSSDNYSYAPEEAVHVVKEICESFMGVAAAFGVECIFSVDDGPLMTSRPALDCSFQFGGVARRLNEDEILELMQAATEWQQGIEGASH